MFSSDRIRISPLSRLLLMLTLLVSLFVLPAHAQTGQKEAEALNSIGLFAGSDKGFELERTPTRAEALVMLLKLTGQAQAAQDSNLPHPFTDGGWASAFIGYGYTHNYTSGMTATEFGTTHPATAQQYSVFLLRALGYTINEDYTYEKALPFFLSHAPALTPEGNTFTRGDMASMSLAALAAPMKDGSGILAEKLSTQGLFSMESYKDARDGAISNKKADVTILAYIVGSDLESELALATDDLNEMLAANLNSSVNLILQTGGTENWQNDWMTDGATQRFQVTDDEIIHLSTLENSLMSHPDTLSNFLRWGVTAYPAQRYIALFWDHGEGTLNGFGVDEMNDRKTLSLGEMSRAFKWADVTFETVIFDACLMGTLTNAHILSEYADYLLASEDLMTLKGLYYTNFLNALSNESKISVEDMSDIIITDYLTNSKRESWEQAAFSLIDLSKMDDVFTQWRNILHQLSQQMYAGNSTALNDALSKTKTYKVILSYDQFDLIDYLEQLSLRGLIQGEELRSSIQNAVLKTESTEGHIANGLAVYIPRNNKNHYWNKARNSLLECGFLEEDLSFFDRFIQL